jgi:transglutaminase-like putative cysteine protease
MKRKMIVLALVFAMLLGTLSGQAVGVDDQETYGENWITWVNPLYQDTITEEKLLNDIASAPAMTLLEDPAQCATETDIIDTIRSTMEAREASLSVTYQTRTVLTGDDILGYVKAALEETDSATQGDYLRWGYQGVKCGYAYSMRNQVYTYTLNYSFTYYTTAAQEAQVTERIQEALDSFAFNEYTTDPEKVQTIYDYICSHVTYDYANLDDDDYTLKYTAYAALIDGTAVCEGYATLLYRMLREVGISTRVIAGIGNGGAHGWNIVKLGSSYYNLDATWDAGRDSYDYYLQNMDNFLDHYRYDDYTTAEFEATYPMASEDYVLLLGDVNDDGTLNEADVARMMKRLAIGDESTWLDFTEDETVDSNDLVRLMNLIAA